ncbi:MAG: hypothetical protein J6N70_14690 [Oribacterium sp.]|nr:hypothetical protein [Oribacterium sp.]
MEETKQVTLEELQQSLMKEMTEDHDTEYYEGTMDMFDRVSKALAEQRKAENEKARIEADKEKSVREAEASESRSKREFWGNVVKAGGQVGAAMVAGFVSIVTVARIINAEDHDKLVLSKAIGFVLKPRG